METTIYCLGLSPVPLQNSLGVTSPRDGLVLLKATGLFFMAAPTWYYHLKRFPRNPSHSLTCRYVIGQTIEPCLGYLHKKHDGTFGGILEPAVKPYICSPHLRPKPQPLNGSFPK